MKKLLFLSICLSGLLGAQTFSNVNPFPIPDNNVVGGQSDIPVALAKTISDPSKVTVNLDLTHTWSGDVTVGLVVPGGPVTGAIALLKRIGSTTPTGVGSSANFGAGNVLSFNSAATGTIVPPVGTNLLIPTGIYLPTVSATLNPTAYTVADLSATFTNLAVNGTWSLVFLDSAAGDTGTLNNWQIVFDAGTFLGVDTTITSTPGLTVMGNPFKETLNLRVNTAAKDVKFDIYSMDGKKVYSYDQSTSKTTSGDLQIATGNWSSGMYILRPTVNGEKLLSIKLLKK